MYTWLLTLHLSYTPTLQVLPSNFTLTANTRVVPVGSPVSFSLSALDPGADTLQFLLDMGDGSDPVSITAPSSELDPLLHAATLEHTYTAPGYYHVVLRTVIDDSTAVEVANMEVTVGE